jgi:hypothetical protein
MGNLLRHAHTDLPLMENLDEAPGEGQLCGSYSNWVYRRSWPTFAGGGATPAVDPVLPVVSVRSRVLELVRAESPAEDHGFGEVAASRLFSSGPNARDHSTQQPRHPH